MSDTSEVFVAFSSGAYDKGIADKMKSVRLVQIFRPVKETNRTHSKGYVEDSRAQRGRKRCAKMAVLNLSVLPKINAFEPFEETAKIIERRGNKTNVQQGLCEGFVDKETGKNALRWRG